MSVSVPDPYTAYVEAELLPNKDIRIKAKPGFSGLALVQYRRRFIDGRIEEGQIWVNVG